MWFADIIFFAVIAIIIGYKLYTILGVDDKERPINARMKQAGGVIDVTPEMTKADEIPEFISFDDKYNQTVKETLYLINQKDKNFTETKFIKGAKGAYEMILDAFSKHDLNILKFLLAENIYREFEATLKASEQSDRYIKKTLVSFIDTVIDDAKIKDNFASVKVKFITEQINIVKNSKDEIIEGNPSYIEKMEDIWVFTKDLSSSNPNWLVKSTNN